MFEIPLGELMMSQYILKSFDGYDGEGHGLATLPDDTKVTLYSGLGAFVLRQATFDAIISELGISVYTFPKVSELPTVEEGQLINGGILNGSGVVNFNGKIKYGLDETENYYFDYNDGSFRVPGEWEDEAPYYTGELEWTEEMPDNVKEVFFREYPYEDIINLNIPGGVCLFQPQKEGEVTSTYWIYSNGTWTNTEDIGKPVEQEIVYGELLEGPTFSTDSKFISPYTNEQICNYVQEGKPVILRYHNEYRMENQFMYVYIYGYTTAEMGDKWVNQSLDYDNFTCLHYFTTDQIRYNTESDYFYYEVGE